jgi:hypothetical protein
VARADVARETRPVLWRQRDAPACDDMATRASPQEEPEGHGQQLLCRLLVSCSWRAQDAREGSLPGRTLSEDHAAGIFHGASTVESLSYDLQEERRWKSLPGRSPARRSHKLGRARSRSATASAVAQPPWRALSMASWKLESGWFP